MNRKKTRSEINEVRNECEYVQADRATFALHITCDMQKSLRRVEAGGGGINKVTKIEAKREEREQWKVLKDKDTE